MEEFLVILKPDAIKLNLCSPILAQLSGPITTFANFRFGKPSQELIRRHYAHLAGNTLERNLSFLTSGNVLAIECTGSIEKARALIGGTDPSKAGPQTIRGKYSKDSIDQAVKENRGLYNLIHCSDSTKSGKMEIALWHQLFKTSAL